MISYLKWIVTVLKTPVMHAIIRVRFKVKERQISMQAHCSFILILVIAEQICILRNIVIMMS